MPWFKMPDGTPVHVKMARNSGPKCDECRKSRAGFECDYEDEKGNACNKKLCNLCRTRIGPGDFCTEHVLVIRELQA